MTLTAPRLYYDEECRHIRAAERAVLRALGVADFLSLEPAALT